MLVGLNVKLWQSLDFRDFEDNLAIGRLHAHFLALLLPQ